MQYTPAMLKVHLGKSYKPEAEYVIETHHGANARVLTGRYVVAGEVPDFSLNQDGTMIVLECVKPLPPAPPIAESPPKPAPPAPPKTEGIQRSAAAEPKVTARFHVSPPEEPKPTPRHRSEPDPVVVHKKTPKSKSGGSKK